MQFFSSRKSWWFPGSTFFPLGTCRTRFHSVLQDDLQVDWFGLEQPTTRTEFCFRLIQVRSNLLFSGIVFCFNQPSPSIYSSSNNIHILFWLYDSHSTLPNSPTFELLSTTVSLTNLQQHVSRIRSKIERYTLELERDMNVIYLASFSREDCKT